MTIQPQNVIDHMERVIVGKRPILEIVLASMIAEGHVLIEDVPGLAKTLLARTLARTFDLAFSRVQLTPDLLPADLTGTGIWDEAKREFTFQQGPVFCQILLADELNRATPRTQAGLLEAMEERAVTEGGNRHPLPSPFFVLATQNPIEQQGVFPLPEAQVDRFLIQISMGYPDAEDELAIVQAQSQSHPIDKLKPIAGLEDFTAMREASLRLHIDPAIGEYIVRIVRATREREELLLGASPRASIGLHRLARALAYVEESEYVLPDHVKLAAPAVLRHRLMLTPQARLAGLKPDQIIETILDRVEVPIYSA